MEPHNTIFPHPSETGELKKLEVVLKCDATGTEEAISSGMAAIKVPGVEIVNIQSGVGNVAKSDILMASTGSRLVIGFNVDITPKLQPVIKEQGVEVRLYDTIYNLMEDTRKIAGRMFAGGPEEKITGSAKIIAIFKGKRNETIIGCEVLEGVIELGRKFRVITAMGPAYSGKISSLQIERGNVKIGKPGQQIGIKIPNWNKAKVGDLVECYAIREPSGGDPWKPRPGVFRSKS